MPKAPTPKHFPASRRFPVARRSQWITRVLVTLLVLSITGWLLVLLALITLYHTVNP